jgi:hypothetical protein
MITLIEGHSYFVPKTHPNSCITGPKKNQKSPKKGVELIALSQFWDFFWVVKTRQVPVAIPIRHDVKLEK